jgi:membrane protease YdiL (CAAX protease family)
METTRIELKLLLFTLIGIVVIEILAALAVTSMRSNPIVFTGMVRLSEIALMIGAITVLGPGLPALGLSRKDISTGLKKGCLWSAGFGLLAAAAGLILLAAGYEPLDLIRTRVTRQISAMMLLLVVGGLIGPVAEEFFFRGIIYGFLRRWGILPALILSTALFVGLHPVHGMAPTQIIGGVLFAAAYEFERNLLVPITIHIFGNLALFSISIIL